MSISLLLIKYNGGKGVVPENLGFKKQITINNMSKKGKIRSYVKVLGEGNECPKCKENMERRKRIKPPTSGKSYFYTEWDYCTKCSHVQHYEQYKSGVWQEAESQASFFKEI